MIGAVWLRSLTSRHKERILFTDMADIKTLLESITRSFGYHYGKNRNVRVNTISQSPTKTTAGSGIKGLKISTISPIRFLH